ncbi:MAG: TolC family protein [Planctomycetota bacterium]|jgi:outer membrane protein TolC
MRTLRPVFRIGPALFVPVTFLAVLAACSTDYYAYMTDDEVDEILGKGYEDVLADRQSEVLYPKEEVKVDPFEEEGGETSETTGAPDAAEETEEVPTPNLEVQKISLIDALEIAFQGNRQYLSERENLYLTALGLINARYNFSPQLSAVLSYLFSDGTDLKREQTTGLGLGMTQDLYYGGSLSLSADTSYLDSADSSLSDRRNFSSSLGVSLSQPLLRGAGLEVGTDSLIQAEHELIYAVRDFELFRQDFSIEVASRYYELVRQLQSIENEKNNMESFEFAKLQAEALFKVGRTNELDVLRARRSELNSRNRLIEAEETYSLSLDRFKVFLGLPTTERIEIIPQEPVFIPINFETETSVDVALANRLDLMNRKERLEDSARSVRIAENGLLPDLDLDLNYNLSSDADPSFSNQKLDNRSYSMGMSLGLPIDRVRERTALRQAQISYGRALRSYEEFRDNLVIEIYSAFRELERRRQSLDIQRQIIVDEEKSAKIAEIRFRRGEIPNRDLVEAQISLLVARNNLINEKVDYEITRLDLLNNLGILFIDEKGMWYE